MTTLPPLYKEEKTGLYLRPDRGEEGIIKEQHATYKTLLIEDRVCLDLGGHIGCFVNYALDQRGAKQVISVEPEPESFSILELNSRNKNAVIINAAVVPNEEVPEIPFYLYKTFSAMNSIYNKRGRVEITVPAVSFSKLLEDYHPDTVKMDIEGSEYTLMDNLMDLPDFVTAIAIELHFCNNPEFLPKAKLIIGGLENQGFKATKEPKVDKTHWAHHFAAMGVWSR